MTKSHTRRFINSAWTLLTFQFIASVGAVGVTGAAALYVSRLAAEVEAARPAPEAAEAIEVEGIGADAQTETPADERPPQAADPTAPPAANDPVQPVAIQSCPRQSPEQRAAVARAQTNGVVFRVPANAEWCDTGAPLQQGQTLVIRAQGRWSDGGDAMYTPAGANQRDRATLCPRAPAAALIGRIGARTFPIGDGLQFTVPGSGTLYLSMNDVSGRFADNQGFVDVQIQVAQTPPPG
jgi:hypothetical protein